MKSGSSAGWRDGFETRVFVAHPETTSHAISFPPLRRGGSQGGFFLTPAREAMGTATILSRSIHCYWLSLPWERAGVRGERRNWLPLPREREPVVSGATAFTLAMVSGGDAFDSSGSVAAIEPSPQPSPEGEGASSKRRHSFHAGDGLRWRRIRLELGCCCNRTLTPALSRGRGSQ